MRMKHEDAKKQTCPLNTSEYVKVCGSICRLYHDYGDGTGDCEFARGVEELHDISRSLIELIEALNRRTP